MCTCMCTKTILIHHFLPNRYRIEPKPPIIVCESVKETQAATGSTSERGRCCPPPIKNTCQKKRTFFLTYLYSPLFAILILFAKVRQKIRSAKYFGKKILIYSIFLRVVPSSGLPPAGNRSA